jgi:hypothetical protein
MARAAPSLARPGPRACTDRGHNSQWEENEELRTFRRRDESTIAGIRTAPTNHTVVKMSRPTVTIIGADGAASQNTHPLPNVFKAPIRSDIVQYEFSNITTHARGGNQDMG